MVHLVVWRTWGLPLSTTESTNVESTPNGVYWDNGSQRSGEYGHWGWQRSAKWYYPALWLQGRNMVKKRSYEIIHSTFSSSKISNCAVTWRVLPPEHSSRVAVTAAPFCKRSSTIFKAISSRSDCTSQAPSSLRDSPWSIPQLPRKWPHLQINF